MEHRLPVRAGRRDQQSQRRPRQHRVRGRFGRRGRAGVDQAAARQPVRHRLRPGGGRPPRSRRARSPSALTCGYSARTNRTAGGTIRGSPTMTAASSQPGAGFLRWRLRAQIRRAGRRRPRGQGSSSGRFPAPRGVPGAGATRVNHPVAAAHATWVGTALARPGGGGTPAEPRRFRLIRLRPDQA